MKAPRNIYGQPLTRMGTVDQRHNRHPRAVNDGQPYNVYDVVERPNEKRSWHVICHVLATGERIRVSRHTKRCNADAAAERLRIKQPDRKPSPKLRHKLGV